MRFDTDNRPNGSNPINLSWIWIVIAVIIFSALFSGHLGGAWWIIFPLFWWVIPMIRNAAMSPEERARREDMRMERRRMKHEYKMERYRTRHPDRYQQWSEAEKRKNDDAESLDDLVDDKPKRTQSPRYVLIGDGEIAPADEVEPEDNQPDDTVYGEPPLRSSNGSDYI